MEKIRFAIIGLGIGKLHLDAVAHNKNAVVTALCDTNEELLKKFAEDYEVPVTCTDYRELVGRDDIDAVCVTTPDFLHREMCMAFLEAGKHVICEKPMALDSADCKAMIDAAEKSGKKFMIGQVCRKTPSFVMIKKLVDEGEIGELFFVESEYAHDYTHIGNGWRNDPNRPRHIVTGGGCHAVDLLRWIAGNPTEVYGLSNRKVLTDWPTDDAAIALMKFPNNVMGKVFVSSGCKRRYTMRTVLYGTKGTIIADNVNATISLFRETVDGKDRYKDAPMENLETRIPVVVNNHNVPGEIEDFCNAILGNQEMFIPGSEGAATVAVCEAIIASAASGMPEKVKYLD